MADIDVLLTNVPPVVYAPTLESSFLSIAAIGAAPGFPGPRVGLLDLVLAAQPTVTLQLRRLEPVFFPVFATFDPLWPELVYEALLGNAMDAIRELRFESLLSEAGDCEFTLAQQPALEFDELLSYTFRTRIQPPSAAAIDPSLITLAIEGEPAITMILEEREDTPIDQGEGADAQTLYRGREHLALLERAVVHPRLGLFNKPIEETRTFDWTSPEYDDSSWASAHILSFILFVVPAPWGAYTTASWPIPWTPAFPDKTAAILAPPGATATDAPPGRNYYRQDFTLSEERADYFIFAASDNVGELFIDGVKIMDVENFANEAGDVPDNWSPVDQQKLTLSAGPHTLAVVCENGPGPTPGPTGVAWALYIAGYPPTLICHSDSSARALYYPTTVPGMTFGQIWYALFEEAHGRDAIPWLDLAFTPTTDSNGQPWPILPAIATQVGTDYYSFMRELAGAYADVWLPAGSLEVEACGYKARGVERDIGLVQGSNLQRLVHQTPLAGPTSLLTRSRAGWDERFLFTGLSRFEGFLNLGQIVDAAEQADMTYAEIIDQDGTTQTDVAFVPLSLAEVPFLAFWPGDSIAIPTPPGLGTDPYTAVRVFGCGVHVEKDRVTFQPTLGRLYALGVARAAQGQKRLINGTLGGRSKRAQPHVVVPQGMSVRPPDVKDVD